LEPQVILAPEDQLSFLAKVQRLFAEGDFTATYKFALIISLAELAVEVGHDDLRPLTLDHRQLASKFIELYWQQTMPYSQGRREPDVLSQNNGRQAAVVAAILRFRKRHPNATLQSAPGLEGYKHLLGQVAGTIADQPVRYLQNLGGTTDQFLYERHQSSIVLNPGVTYCLRRFQPLVQQLARIEWIDHVKRNRRNFPIIDDHDDLQSFLFETPRQALNIIGSGLRKLSNQCFYCESALREGSEVDHFVPFSLYPRDLIHNFVLAHGSCNRSKSNSLAARPHLERWAHYIVKHDDDLMKIAEDAGCLAHAETSRAVARWSYTNAAQSGAKAWQRKDTFELVDLDYLGLI
jgi:5-methylcytosine-specific restriction endonuclease McrA